MRNSTSDKGFSLLELALVLSAAGIIAGSVIPGFVRTLYVEAGRKSALEISQIQEASRAYYVKKKSWPADIQALKTEGYLDPEWNALNPFGKSYELQQKGQALEVKTTISAEPAGVILNLLPMAVYESNVLSSDVTQPGVDSERLPVGAVIPWPSMDIPAGWMLCDGHAVSRKDYPVLFALLGTGFGAGDGVTTFNLPDLRGRVVVGMDNMGGSVANVISGNWSRKMGGKAGEENHQLTIEEMPSHHHYGFGENFSWWPYGVQGPNSNTGPNSSDNDNYLLGTTPSGGNMPHNIVQPSMSMNWIIKG